MAEQRRQAHVASRCDLVADAVPALRDVYLSRQNIYESRLCYKSNSDLAAELYSLSMGNIRIGHRDAAAKYLRLLDDQVSEAYKTAHDEESVVINARTDSHTSNVADAMYKTGMLALELGDYDGAEKHFKRLISLGNARCDSLSWLGLVYFSNKRYGDALGAFKDALSTLEETDPYRGHLLCNIGILERLQGLHEASISSLEESEKICMSHKDPIGACKARYSQGLAYHEMGDMSKAIGVYEVALKEMMETCPGDTKINVLEGLLKEMESSLRYETHPEGPVTRRRVAQCLRLVGTNGESINR